MWVRTDKQAVNRAGQRSEEPRPGHVVACWHFLAVLSSHLQISGVEAAPGCVTSFLMTCSLLSARHTEQASVIQSYSSSCVFCLLRPYHFCAANHSRNFLHLWADVFTLPSPGSRKHPFPDLHDCGHCLCHNPYLSFQTDLSQT